MKATRLILAAMVLGTAIGVSEANAQLSCTGGASCSVTNSASAVVGTLIKLSQTSASTALGDPTATDIETGNTIPSNGPTLTIKANRAWTLKISTSQANFSYSGPDVGVKPISHLTWSGDNSTFAAITTTGDQLAGGAKTSSVTQNVFFKTQWVAGMGDPSNAAGTYTLPIVFTLSAP